MDQFSLSASFDDDELDNEDPLPGDCSYLKSESIENVESSSDFDSDTELVFLKKPLNARQQQFAEYVALSPNKVTVPGDGAMFRARVLSFGTTNGVVNSSTDIW